MRAHRKAQAAERLAPPVQWSGPDYVFTTEMGRAWRPAQPVPGCPGRGGQGRRAEGRGSHAAPCHGVGDAEAGIGIGITVVSDTLGHWSLAITGDIYAHVSDGAAQAASDTRAGGFGI